MSLNLSDKVIQIDGKSFVPAEAFPIPDWPCTLSEQPLPTLTIKDDDSFLVSDTLGNIAGCLEDDIDGSLGLFCADTRFLSRLELQIDRRTPVLLNSTADKGYLLSVLCTNPRSDRLKPDTIAIARTIVLHGGLFEEITLTNYSSHVVDFELSLSFDADFVDLFEVRGQERPQRGQRLRQLAPELLVDDDGRLPNVVSPHSSTVEAITLAYRGLDGVLVESRIEFEDQKPSYLQGYTAVWQLSLASHETRTLRYRLCMALDSGPASQIEAPAHIDQAICCQSRDQDFWLAQATEIRCDRPRLNAMLQTAERDIHRLWQVFPGGKALCAGIPWFATLFGRDSLIAASQTLILDPTIARETLAILAHYQGKVDDAWREEQPGKILHELRTGEMARCNEIPHTPYYGTVDATPLWILLYCDYYTWTNDWTTLQQLWPNAIAAMDWIDRNLQETGYLRYQRRSSRGLLNQGWKDSEDCIVDRQGNLVRGPIALCEVQAYVYAAKQRLSAIARLHNRPDLAQRWQQEAQALKVRFNRDFWVEDLGFCALALDGEGKPADSIASNPGHCLSLEILTPDKALQVARRLGEPDLFSGWGIRTLSSDSPAYNPMGYHIGSVWPHDNGLIALGLRSLGLVEQAVAVALGTFDMVLRQPYQRPPELFCGYARQGDSDPVRYPVACTPQAWASGSIFQLLQVLLNLTPDAHNGCLRIVQPFLPESLPLLSLKRLRVGSAVVDLEFERYGKATACRVVSKQGELKVLIEA